LSIRMLLVDESRGFLVDMVSSLGGCDLIILAGNRAVHAAQIGRARPDVHNECVFQYVHAVGGIDTVATALADLGGKIDGEKLSALAKHFDRACAQRLGYLLDRLGHTDRAQALQVQLSAIKPLVWVALEPLKRGAKPSESKPVERNERWRVSVQRHPEVDE